MKPAELEKLRQASAGRYAALSQGQRDRLRDNLFILLVTISTADYETAADFDPPNAVVDSTRQANLTV